VQRATARVLDRRLPEAAALGTVFASSGFLLATWASRVPAIRGQGGLAPGQVALLLWALACGYVLGLALSGPAVARVAAGRLLLWSSVTACTALAWVGLDPRWRWRVAGLVVLGACGGLWESTMNLRAGRLEAETGRRVMPRLHAAFSTGGAAGLVCGGLAARWHVPVGAHFPAAAGALGMLIAVALLGSRIGVEAGDGPRRAGRAAGTGSAWTDRRTLALGVLLLGIATAEGAAADWLPLVLVDGYRQGQARAAAGLLLFVTAVIVARLAASALPSAARGDRVLAAGLLLLTAGPLMLASGDPSPSGGPRAVGGVLCWAAGVALGFPLIMSVAARAGRAAGGATDGVAPGARVGAVSAIGYLGFMVGPLPIGWLAGRVGLTGALLAVPVVAGCAALAAALCHPTPVRARLRSARQPAPDVGEQSLLDLVGGA